MEYRVLGPLEVVDDDGHLVDLRRSKPRLAMALMLTRPNQVVSVDAFLDVLWPNDPPAQPQQTLQVHISRLRGTLGRSDVIVTRNPGYLLRVAPDELDAEVAERLIGEARRAFDAGDYELAIERFQDALSLGRGDPLAEFRYDDFAQGEIERLTELRLGALESLSEARLAAGRHGELIPELEALVAGYPMRERLWMSLMLALYRSGRQADALRAFARAKAMLASELGIEPSPAMAELEEQILLQDEGLELTPASAVTAVPGLPEGRIALLFSEGIGSQGLAVPSLPQVEELINSHGGVVERSAGARVYAGFQIPDDAIAAAVAIHRLFGEGVRSAVHVDDLVPAGGRYVGGGPNRCAAVLGIAGEGQLLLTEEAAGTGSPPPSTRFMDVGDYLLGGNLPERIHQVIGDGLAQGASPLRAAPLPRSNLFDPPTTFVGRERELAELSGLLDDRRLVTITGPGGVGKSRLATRVGLRTTGFPDGTWRVDLSDGTEARFVTSSVAAVLGIEEEEGNAWLFDALSSRRCLIILDNCDAVIDSVASLVESILERCPDVKLIVTSRERLDAQGEALFPLASLTAPSPTSATAIDVSRAESIQLLCERAQAVDPSFRLTDENAAALSAICTLLDGLPLALELAAARLDVMSPRELAARLEETLDVLVGRRAFVPRHRTMADVVDWSVRLLDPPTRSFAARLTAMASSFDIDAARVITHESAALDMLSDLTAKSLVAQTRVGERTRFHLPRPVRDRLSGLVPDGERLALAQRHLDHYARVVENARKRLRTPEEAAVLDELEADQGELAAALDWGLENGHDTALAMASSLWRFWLRRGRVVQGRSWLEKALAASSADSEHRLEALHGAGMLAYALGDYAAAEQLRAEELALARRRGDEVAMASALVFLGSIARMRNDSLAAAQMLEEGLSIHASIEEKEGLASALSMLGAVGEFRQPLLDLCRDSLDMFRRRGDDWGTATALLYMATVIAGDEREGARSMLLEAGRLFTQLGDFRGSAQCILELAFFAKQGEAVRLLAASEAIRHKAEVEPSPAARKKLDRLRRQLQRDLGDRFEDEWEVGAALSAEAALELVSS